MKGFFQWLIAALLAAVQRHPVAAPVTLGVVAPVAATALVDPQLLADAVHAVVRLLLALFASF